MRVKIFLLIVILFGIFVNDVKADTLELDCIYKYQNDYVDIKLRYNTDGDYFSPLSSGGQNIKNRNGNFIFGKENACDRFSGYNLSEQYDFCPQQLCIKKENLQLGGTSTTYTTDARGTKIPHTSYYTYTEIRCYVTFSATCSNSTSGGSFANLYTYQTYTYEGDLQISKKREFDAKMERMKYKDVEICEDKGWEYINACGCMPASLTDLTSRLYKLLKIGAPALLLVIGGFEMIKAMTSQDEASIKKAEQKLVKKFVAAAAIFLILTVVQFLASVLSTDSEMLECLSYLLDGYNV